MSDEEIRIKCAEAMGWMATGIGPKGSLHKPSCACCDGWPCIIPNYTQSLDAAMELVEWAGREPFNFAFNLDGPGPIWTARFRNHCVLISADDKSPALAICKAFLAATTPQTKGEKKE